MDDATLPPDSNSIVDFVSRAKARKKPEPEDWPEPEPLNGLLPVMKLDPGLLPRAIAPWVMDIADRLQCPLDFVAIPAVVALGSVIGRKIAIRPQRLTDWYEVPNLWGCIVGRPGVLKTPAVDQALKPLQRLEADARKDHGAALKAHAVEVEAFKLRKEDAQKRGRSALKNGSADIASILSIDEPEGPKERRYIVNDTTYEKLGAINADNPNGILAHRDELISLLKSLDREEAISARGFYLTAWGGQSGYTFDRIIRGKTYIEAACVSILGTTQPGRLIDYIQAALSYGAADDGMIQRFSLLVWPDHSPEWSNKDRYPASEPRERAWDAFQRLNDLTASAAGAEKDDFTKIPFLRFDQTAQKLFEKWREDLERKVRGGDLTPALESHLSKYRKAVPALALINHLADGYCGPVGKTELARSLAFADYLESHAQRAYGAGCDVGTHAAKAILSHIRKGDLKDGFTSRDVHRPKWSGLVKHLDVQEGLATLVDFSWLRSVENDETGGRPSLRYYINPKAGTPR